jgi:hypothetical protein
MRNDACHSDAMSPHIPEARRVPHRASFTSIKADLTAFEPPRQRHLAPASARSEVQTGKASLEDSWPVIMIGGGIVLTVVWNVSLLWLLVRMILTVF